MYGNPTNKKYTGITLKFSERKAEGWTGSEAAGITWTVTLPMRNRPATATSWCAGDLQGAGTLTEFVGLKPMAQAVGAINAAGIPGAPQVNAFNQAGYFRAA